MQVKRKLIRLNLVVIVIQLLQKFLLELHIIVLEENQTETTEYMPALGTHPLVRHYHMVIVLKVVAVKTKPAEKLNGACANIRVVKVAATKKPIAAAVVALRVVVAGQKNLDVYLKEESYSGLQKLNT